MRGYRDGAKRQMQAAPRRNVFKHQAHSLPMLYIATPEPIPHASARATAIHGDSHTSARIPCIPDVADAAGVAY